MSSLTRAIRFVRHWHARVGVLAAIFLLLLSLTGIALSHTDALGLSKRAINQDWLMRWYGLESAVPTQGYLFEDGYFAWADGRWVMDGKTLLHDSQAPVGAVTWNGMRGLAGAEVLYLYLPDGRLVDKLTGAELPATPLIHIGSLGTSLALETAQGSFVSDDGLSWQPLHAGRPVWSSAQRLPSSLTQTLRAAFAPSLPLERIVLDLHSGRIFGRYGALVLDFVALVLVVLSISGVWIYLRAVRRQHHHG